MDDEFVAKKMKSDEISNVAGAKSRELPSFWIPQLNPTAEKRIEKPVPFQISNSFSHYYLFVPLRTRIIYF